MEWVTEQLYDLGLGEGCTREDTVRISVTCLGVRVREREGIWIQIQIA